MQASYIAITLLLVGLATVFAQELYPSDPIYRPRQICPMLQSVESDLEEVKNEDNAGPEYQKAKVAMDGLLKQKDNEGLKSELEGMKANEKVKIEGDSNLYQKKFGPYLMTPVKEECQEREYLVYGVFHMDGYCWLPWPTSQNIRYTECTGFTKSCNRNSWPWNQRSYCVKSNYVAKYFHAYCPHLGIFKKLAWRFPQCCVCRSFSCGFWKG